jgi:curved DNA-binding protein CbpA
VTEERDPYQVLGVSPDAGDDEIRKAYHARARRLHPDVVGESGLDEMRHLNQAWAVLKDPDRRAAHDSAHGRVPHRATTRRDGAAGASDGGGDRTGAPRAPTGDFAGQPAWTGAAGPPPGRPWGTVLDFGIYAGWSLGEIARRDRGYLAWLRDKPEAKRLRPEIVQLLETTAPNPDADKDRKGGKGGKKRR